MSVLVAAPACERKSYSLKDWAAATRGYARLLVVDACEWKWGDWASELYGIEVGYYSARGDIYGSKYNAAWKRILEGSLGHEFILALETDVIPPKGCNIVETMHEQWDKGHEFLRHGVPWRESYGREGRFAYETGCTLGRCESWAALLRSCHDEPLYSAIHHASCKDVNLVALEHRDSPAGYSPRHLTPSTCTGTDGP